MSYNLHIVHAEMTEEEEPVPIPLKEWRAAVAATEGVRLFADKVHILDIPGHVLCSPANEGDVEVWSPKDRQWHWGFRWEGGSATFSSRVGPGDMSHPVWAAAVSLASRLGAVIRGDEGETYDLQTGQARSSARLSPGNPSHPVWAGAVALASRLGAMFRGDKVESFDLQAGQVWNSVAVPRQEMTLVFAPKGIADRDVIEAAQLLFVKHGIPPSGFEFDGVASELEISKRMKRRTNPPIEVKGRGFTIQPASYVASWHLSRTDIEAETPIQIPWDEWVIELFNESFVMAWVADVDYQFWQNAEDLLHYRSVGRPWKHLPTKSNGLPPPLERTIVDISYNPGRWAFRVGFIEAVGAVMWFGDRFWQVTGADRQQVPFEPWLQCAEIVPGLLRVQAAQQCFSTDQGEVGDLQRKLRALLFHVRSQR
jgi:hypothetical protein